VLVRIVAMVLAALAAASFAFAVAHRRYADPHPASTSQCDLPVEQRTGGWVCP
jgi:hypothetical protein